jgi:hypothetical protein
VCRPRHRFPVTAYGVRAILGLDRPVPAAVGARLSPAGDTAAVRDVDRPMGTMNDTRPPTKSWGITSWIWTAVRCRSG